MDIDEFLISYPTCTTINGNLLIEGESSDITNLDGFANLTTVTGQFRINFTGVTTLSPLSNLTSVGGLFLDSNPNITSLNGLNGLTSLGSTLSIFLNENLTDISALENIASFSGVEVELLGNTLLSECAIASFCANISDLESATLGDNGTGCNEYVEIEAACQTLPVTLTNFRAINEQSTALLTWSTTYETNFDQFSIERSQTGKTWQTVGIVAAKGSSSYSFTDKSALSGLNYYRLKMIDRDGSNAYSQIVSVRIKSDVAIYPNPVAEKILFKNVDISSIQHLQLFNSAGLLVLENSKIQSSGVDVRKVPVGIYTAMLTYKNGATKSFQLIKD